MSIKNVVVAQYKEILDKNVGLAEKLKVPGEGWLRTTRKALGMTASQLASRLHVSRILVSRTEYQELNGAVTMKTMHKMAQAMSCRFIYAIVPEKNIDDLILEQAIKKAKYIVNKTNVNMALEEQLLSGEKIRSEVDRLTKQILKEHLSNLWDDDGRLKK